MKPKLPKLLQNKIYKTGQTRGADDDVIYQNRVARSSTVLIPYQFANPIIYPEGEGEFENGFIVLISPKTYFSDKKITTTLKKQRLILGENSLIFFETRQDWENYNPEKIGWRPAKNRKAPLGGNYVARVPATTAIKNSGKIIRGFNTTSNKGAGIRFYEYASSRTINEVRTQLEAIYWLTYDSVEVAVQNGMSGESASARMRDIFDESKRLGLLDYDRLRKSRIIDKDYQAVCPLCKEKLSAKDFYSRMVQVSGREVPDITVTEINLFHISELRPGVYNHQPYNLGWGHHHCNVVTKDAGISKTLEWMQRVIERNREEN